MQNFENHPQINQVRLMIFSAFMVLLVFSYMNNSNNGNSPSSALKQTQTKQVTSVYSSPNKQDVLGSLPANTKVDIIEIDKNENVSKIRIKDGFAWVDSHNLEM